MFYAIAIVLILIADQGVKYWVSANITLNTGTMDFLPGFLHLTNVHNTGSAFSMLERWGGARWLFLAITAAFVVFCIWALAKRRLRSRFARWVVAIIIAGALGNAIDRAVQGYVVDMFSFEGALSWFPIFNVADIALVVGAVLFCLYILFHRDPSSSAEPGAEDAFADEDFPPEFLPEELPVAEDAPEAEETAPKAEEDIPPAAEEETPAEEAEAVLPAPEPEAEPEPEAHAPPRKSKSKRRKKSRRRPDPRDAALAETKAEPAETVTENTAEAAETPAPETPAEEATPAPEAVREEVEPEADDSMVAAIQAKIAAAVAREAWDIPPATPAPKPEPVPEPVLAPKPEPVSRPEPAAPVPEQKLTPEEQYPLTDGSPFVEFAPRHFSPPPKPQPALEPPKQTTAEGLLTVEELRRSAAEKTRITVDDEVVEFSLEDIMAEFGEH